MIESAIGRKVGESSGREQVVACIKSAIDGVRSETQKQTRQQTINEFKPTKRVVEAQKSISQLQQQLCEVIKSRDGEISLRRNAIQCACQWAEQLSREFTGLAGYGTMEDRFKLLQTGLQMKFAKQNNGQVVVASPAGNGQA